MKDKKFLLDLDKKVHAEIKERAAREAMTMADFIREAINNHLEHFIDKDLENLVKKRGVYRIQEGLNKLKNHK